jgi:hypothetical protein
MRPFLTTTILQQANEPKPRSPAERLFDNHLGIPLIMGSPLYGTVAATSLVGAGPNNVLGLNTRLAMVGVFVWILIHSSAAAILFAATLATFNYCLGRTSDRVRPRDPGVRKKPPWGPMREFDNWIGDDELEESPSSQ